MAKLLIFLTLTLMMGACVGFLVVYVIKPMWNWLVPESSDRELLEEREQIKQREQLDPTIVAPTKPRSRKTTK